jgi:hypothetical protein
MEGHQPNQALRRFGFVGLPKCQAHQISILDGKAQLISKFLVTQVSCGAVHRKLLEPISGLQFAEVDRNSKPQPGRLWMRDFEVTRKRLTQARRPWRRSFQKPRCNEGSKWLVSCDQQECGSMFEKHLFLERRSRRIVAVSREQISPWELATRLVGFMVSLRTARRRRCPACDNDIAAGTDAEGSPTFCGRHFRPVSSCETFRRPFK